MTDTGNTRPGSTATQKWSAVLLAVIAIAVVSIALLGWMVVTVFGRAGDGFSDSDGPHLMRQAACLAYSDFVLDQHHNGLSPEQIEGVVRYAGAHDTTTPAGFEDPELCGTPQQIIHVAQVTRP